MIIDFNNHCLPNMSDGTSSVAKSIEVLNELKSQNILNLFITPMYLNSGETVRAFINRRNNSYNLIAKQIPRGMHLHLSAKVLFTQDTFDNLYIKRLTYKKSPYLFLELPKFADLSWLEFELYYLLHKANLRPIFTNFDLYCKIYDEKIYSWLMKIPYATYQFGTNSFSVPENIEIINKLCTDDKTVVFGTDAANLSSGVILMRENIDTLKTSLPISIYRKLILNNIKLYNKIIK